MKATGNHDNTSKSYQNENRQSRLLFQRAEDKAFQSVWDTDDKLFAPMEDWPLDLTEDEKALIVTRTAEKMNLLGRLNQLCDQLKISYFAIGSLLRSAVFFCKTVVPDHEEDWSIGLLRPDYEKLLHALRGGEADATLCVLEAIPDTHLPLLIPLVCSVPCTPGEELLPAGILIYPFDRLPQTNGRRQQLWRKTASICHRFDLACQANHVAKATGLLAAANRVAQEYADITSPYWGRVLKTNGTMARESDLFPTQGKQLGDLVLPCPANPSIWVLHPSSMADPDVLEAINKTAGEQKTEILKYLDQLCTKNQLQYFCYGKLLQGCVHYAGPIPNEAVSPWDIGLLRPDYEKLVALLQKANGQDGFYLVCNLEETQLPAPLAVLQKNGTFLYEGIEINRPFRVILAPIEQIPDGYDHFCGFVRRMRRLNANYSKILWVQNRPQPNDISLRFHCYRLIYGWRSAKRYFAKLNRVAGKYTGKSYANRYSRMIPSRSKLAEQNQIFPLERRPFSDTTLPCPCDINPWTSVMDEALTHQITEIQKADLRLLTEFDRVCKKLGIGYFVCGGTMLGYVRHGGFIPWDDDIDVGLLRADYDRFVAEAGPLLNEECFLQTRQSDPKIPYLFSKIRLNNTEYVTKYNELRPFHKGICLDLFPFDAIPDDPDELASFLAEVNRKVKLHNRCANKAEPEPINLTGPVSLEDAFLRTIGFLHRAFYRCVPLTWTQKAYLKVATRYNDTAKARGLTSVASFVPSYTYIRRNDLLPYRQATFSGAPASVPNRPEVFLTMQYGDFMQLPPLHLQAGHPLIRWSVDVKADAARQSNDAQEAQTTHQVPAAEAAYEERKDQ